MKTLDRKIVEHLYKGLYRFNLVDTVIYTSYGKLPDWAKSWLQMDLRERRAEARQRRIKEKLGRDRALWGQAHLESPTSRLNHSELVALAYVESICPGESCAGGEDDSQGRKYVNCWDDSDWIRHEQEALR